MTDLMGSSSATDVNRRLNILIADDDLVQRRVCTTMLKETGHHLVEVADGTQALDALMGETHFDCVITDWHMPGTPAADLITAIREQDTDKYTYIIILSASGDDDTVDYGITVGADDYLTKPLDKRALRHRLRVATRITGLHQRLGQRTGDLEVANRDLARARQQVERDLTAAARVQRDLLPKQHNIIRGLDCSWALDTCDAIGGDTILLDAMGDDQMAFAVVDVSGHGIKAAMLTVQIYRHLDVMRDRNLGITDDPPSVLDDLNKAYQIDANTVQFFTMVYGVINSRTGDCRFANAGHPEPIIRRIDGSTETVQNTPCPPIGVVRPNEAVYWLNDCTLNPGDCMVCYSDGLTEAFGPEGQMFGLDRLKETIAKPINGAQSLIANIKSDLRDWNGNKGLKDDMSLLVIRMKEDNATSGRLPNPPSTDIL